MDISKEERGLRLLAALDAAEARAVEMERQKYKLLDYIQDNGHCPPKVKECGRICSECWGEWLRKRGGAA